MVIENDVKDVNKVFIFSRKKWDAMNLLYRWWEERWEKDKEIMHISIQSRLFEKAS